MLLLFFVQIFKVLIFLQVSKMKSTTMLEEINPKKSGKIVEFRKLFYDEKNKDKKDGK
jgi:hypothetical protein